MKTIQEIVGRDLKDDLSTLDAEKFFKKHGKKKEEVKSRVTEDIDLTEEMVEEMAGANMDVRQVHKHLKKSGWSLSRTSGGHDVYTHPKSTEHISVPRHKSLKAPLVLGIMKTAKRVTEDVVEEGAWSKEVDKLEGKKGRWKDEVDKLEADKPKKKLAGIDFAEKRRKDRLAKNGRMDEESITEGDIYSIKNEKLKKTYHYSKYPITKNTEIYKKIKAAGGDHVHAKIHKNGKPIEEEVEQLEEGLKVGDNVIKKLADGTMMKGKLTKNHPNKEHVFYFHPHKPAGSSYVGWTHKDSMVKEEVEQLEESSITHIVAKKDLKDHKEKMDSEGYDTNTRNLPKSHPKHLTHVGIVSKHGVESSYHEDLGHAVPIHEEYGQLEEGRPSQRHPLEGHEYHKKSDAELKGIAKDAGEAAEAMKGHSPASENKYRDQVNDSATVRHFRKTSGMPDWYKKKYGHIKEGFGDLGTSANELARQKAEKEKNEKDVKDKKDSMLKNFKNYQSGNVRANFRKEEVELVEAFAGDEVKIHAGEHKDKTGVIKAFHGNVCEIKPKGSSDHIYAHKNHVKVTKSIDESVEDAKKLAKKGMSEPDSSTSITKDKDGNVTSYEHSSGWKKIKKSDPMSRTRSLAQKGAKALTRKEEIVRETIDNAVNKIKAPVVKISGKKDKFEKDPVLTPVIIKNG